MPFQNANSQDFFLKQVRQDNVEVEIMLLNGAMLKGKVTTFDNFTVLINIDGMQHMIYKHSIAQIIAPKSAMRPPQPQTSQPNSPEGAPRQIQNAPPQPRRPRETRPAVPHKDAAKQSEKQQTDKFNALDFSNIRIEDKQDAPGPSAKPMEEAAAPVANAEAQ